MNITEPKGISSSRSDNSSSVVNRKQAVPADSLSSPKPLTGEAGDEELTPEDILSTTYIMPVEKYRYRKRYIFLNLSIGVAVGLCLAFFFVVHPTGHSAVAQLSDYVALSLSELTSAGVEWSSIFPSGILMDDFIANITRLAGPGSIFAGTELDAGLNLAEELGLKPYFPTIIIPGIVSTGLESWSTANCSRKYFRKRMWGTLSMFRAVLTDKACWTEHLKLDPITGLDPPNIKLRAAQGLEAADYFVPGLYWIWAPIIGGLAAMGYDNNNLHLAAYDWRLSFANLENRDHYFTKLKFTIELSKITENRKTVILCHSMGTNVFYYFLKWVESDLGGKGGPKWVENHIETFVNIAGPMIGVPKAMTVLLSGETRDTAQLGSLGAYLLEKFFDRQERALLFRSWGGASALLMKGGDTFWGNLTWAPDDDLPYARDISHGNFLAFPEKTTEFGPTSMTNQTSTGAMKLLNEAVVEDYRIMLRTNYSFGLSRSVKELKDNDKKPVKWTNPLESKLPMAPSMKIACLYGVNKETERSYYYVRKDLPSVSENSTKNPNDVPWDIYIDGSRSDLETHVAQGIRYSDGDGTCPLLTLGYMCATGWRDHSKLYNPANSPVIIKEYKDEPASLELRGGLKAADHVDILGNLEMLEDIFKIVSNRLDLVQERIISPIEEYGRRIKLEHLP